MLGIAFLATLSWVLAILYFQKVKQYKLVDKEENAYGIGRVLFFVLSLLGMIVILGVLTGSIQKNAVSQPAPRNTDIPWYTPFNIFFLEIFGTTILIWLVWNVTTLVVTLLSYNENPDLIDFLY